MTFRWPRVTVGKLLRSFLSDSSYLYIHLFDMANPLWNFRQKKISGGAAALGEHPGSLPQPRPAPLPHRGGRVEALPIPLLTDGWGGSPSPNQSIDEKIGGDFLRARPEPAGGGGHSCLGQHGPKSEDFGNILPETPVPCSIADRSPSFPIHCLGGESAGYPQGWSRQWHGPAASLPRRMKDSMWG